MGEIVLTIFALFGVLGIVLLAVGILTKRRWTTGFELKRIRSGIETLLAAQGVSREVRGHLQSHGLTGVQARHYDGHNYMLEKRQALQMLVREVCGSAKSPMTQADVLQ